MMPSAANDREIEIQGEIHFPMIGSVVLLCLIFLAFALAGCAGPSKARYAQLLHECREANRERARLIHEYERADCRFNPEQDFGSINFGEAGH